MINFNFNIAVDIEKKESIYRFYKVFKNPCSCWILTVNLKIFM